MSPAQHIRDWWRLNRSFVADKRRAWARRALRPSALPDPQAMPQAVQADAPCVFVLSTGRCGTLALTRVLQLNAQLDVHHKPAPELAWPGRAAYEGLYDEPALAVATLFARYELIRGSYVRGLTYVETSNRVTFLAPSVAKVFTASKFIHLVRHPGEFVRSGMRRGYYQGGELDEVRIQPPLALAAAPRQERVAWLWNATNAAIEHFKSDIDEARVRTVRAEDFFSNPQVSQDLFAWLGVAAPTSSAIAAVLQAPSNENPKTLPPFPHYKDLDTAARAAIRAIVPLAAHYGYDLA